MVNLGTEPGETGKDRAERLRRERKPDYGGPPPVKRVIIEQSQYPVPAGVRFDLGWDTRQARIGLTISFDSKEGARDFLEFLRFSFNRVGVDYDIKDYAPKVVEKPTRVV